MTPKILYLTVLFTVIYGQYIFADGLSDFRKKLANADSAEKLRLLREISPEETDALKKLAIFLRDPHPKVSRNAIDALAGLPRRSETAEYVSKEIAAKKDMPEYARCAAIKLLAILKCEVQKPLLTELAGDKNALVRAEAINALYGMADDENTLNIIISKLSDPAWQVRVSAIDALGKTASDCLPDKVATLIQDPDFRVRIAALEAGKRTDKKQYLVQTAFKDEAWQVRACAIEAAAETGDSTNVELLINAFLTENGRLQTDVFTALQKTTGKDIGFSPKLWKEWWDIFRDRFKPARAGRIENPFLPIAATNAFCGIPVTSQNVIFIIDMSGSMREEIGKNGPRRIDMAKNEINKVLKKFTKDVKFNIILLGSDSAGNYNARDKVFEERLTNATDDCKNKAAKFIARQEPSGWTNTYDAIMAAFNDKDVDTVYLLSDGVPSRGTFVSSSDILENIKNENRFRKIRINTIKTGSEKRGEKLMRQLAEITSGSYMNN